MKKAISLILTFLDLILFCNGQNLSNTDFFPIAVWLQSPENAKSYKDSGINTFVGLWKELDQVQFDRLKEAGMKLICAPNEFGLAHKNDPLIFGWMHGDEPDNAQWNEKTKSYDPCIDPKEIIEFYYSIKKQDPDHPFYLNLGQGVSYTNWVGRGACKSRTDLYPAKNNGYIKGCDIVSFDIYPVNSNDTAVSGKLWMVPKGIDSLKAWSDNAKPVWTWIETTFIGQDSPRKPTVKEVKAQVWMAIIHGAKGIGYFCHSFFPESDEAALLHDPIMISGVKEINSQINSLAQILNAPSMPGCVLTKSSDSMIPVSTMVKCVGNTTYLFAITLRNKPVKVTFTLKDGNHAEILGENRSLSVTDNHFEDDFEGYGMHIYRITP